MSEVARKASILGLVVFKVPGGYRVSNLDGAFSFDKLREVFCE